MVRINFKKIVPEAVEPTKAHDNDAGYDMVATSKKVTDQYIQYGTGIAMEIPDGYVGLIYPRSSVTKKDLMLKNSVGVIDAGYRGEISFRFAKLHDENTIMYGVDNPEYVEPEPSDDGRIFNLPVYPNTDDNPRYIWKCKYNDYQIGDRIGQIIFQKLPDTVLLEVEELEDSERGEGGYGSTDKLPNVPVVKVGTGYVATGMDILDESTDKK